MVRRTIGGRSDRKDPKKKATRANNPSRARGLEKSDRDADDLIAEDENGPFRTEQDDPDRARAARSRARASDPSARLEHGDSVEEEARSYDVAADRDDYERGYGLRDHDRDAATANESASDRDDEAQDGRTDRSLPPRDLRPKP